MLQDEREFAELLDPVVRGLLTAGLDLHAVLNLLEQRHYDHVRSRLWDAIGVLDGTVADIQRAIVHAARDRGPGIQVIDHTEPFDEQVRHALGDRAAIEQATGILAERYQLSVEAAFTALVAHAQERTAYLPDVARAVVTGTADPSGELP